ncbi:MAG: RidA family protein [Planctomycetota bacterium]
MKPEQRLANLGYELPAPPAPVASYVPWIRTGPLVVTAGQIPVRDGVLIASGRAPDEVDPDVAKECAMWCAINGLAVVKAAVGELERVRRVVRLGVFVNSAPGFGDHPSIANAASELMQAVFGDIGRHARSAVGCSSLPLNAPVEIEFTFEVD